MTNISYYFATGTEYVFCPTPPPYSPPIASRWATTGRARCLPSYDTFGANGIRRGTVYRYTNGPSNPFNLLNSIFLLGQQYFLNGSTKRGSLDPALVARTGAPLALTRTVSIIETESGQQVMGIRPMQYPPDFANNASGAIDNGNDLVHFRLPDVLLMKAETILRGVLQLNRPPDALFAAGDSAAVGARQVAKEHGLRVPHDLALEGFSNAEFSGLTEPPLTTVDQCSHLP